MVFNLIFIYFCIRSSLGGFHRSAGLTKSWDDGKIYCKKHGMVMAKIDSEENTTAAVNFINNKVTDVWIGLKIFGDGPYSYRWTDGQYATYMDWRQGVTACNKKLFGGLRKKRCVRLGRTGGSFAYQYDDYKLCNSKCSDRHELFCKGPEPTAESLNTTSVSVSFKRRLILVCSYNSTVTVTKIYWRIYNAFVSNEINVNFTGNDGIAVYVRDKFEKEDVGSYQCFVENMAGTAKGNITDVNLKPDTPTVEVNQTDLKVFESNKTVLFCMPYGYPDVKSITWSGPSGKIQASEQRLGDVSALIFESTRLADEGTYTCSVSNELGSANSTGLSIQVFLDETYCECDCEYKEKLIYWSTIEQQAHTKEDLLRLLRPELMKLAKDTRLDVSQLSSMNYKRKSRKIKNQKAESMGIVAILVIAGVFCLALIVDMISWRKHLRVIRLSTR